MGNINKDNVLINNTLACIPASVMSFSIFPF